MTGSPSSTLKPSTIKPKTLMGLRFRVSVRQLYTLYQKNPRLFQAVDAAVRGPRQKLLEQARGRGGGVLIKTPPSVFGLWARQSGPLFEQDPCAFNRVYKHEDPI